MKRKTKAELQAELDAANKRCNDLADALVRALMAQPVYVPYFVPQPAIVPNPYPWWGQTIEATPPVWTVGTPDVICGGAIPSGTTVYSFSSSSNPPGTPRQ